MIHFVVEPEGDFGIRDYLGEWGKALQSRIRVITYDALAGSTSVPSGAWIFAGLDQLLPAGRQLVRELHRQLLAAGPGVRILNPPDHALLRYELLEELYRRGLNRHHAARASDHPQALRFPVFLRNEHGHDGALSPLLHTRQALEAALGAELLRGRRRSDLLAVEFQETADAAGYYRKYAAFIVGAEIIPRSLALGRQWMLKHAATEFSAELFQEEERYVRDNPHEAELRHVAGLAQVQYGRIDYAVCDGAIVIWEINLNPTIGRGSRSSGSIPEALRALRKGTRDHFYGRLQAAFEAVDLPDPPRLIPVSLPAALPSALTRPRDVRTRWSGLYGMLGPLQPVMKWSLAVLAPLVGRAALRRRGR